MEERRNEKSTRRSTVLAICGIILVGAVLLTWTYIITGLVRIGQEAKTRTLSGAYIFVLNDEDEEISDSDARRLAETCYRRYWIRRFVDDIPIKRVSAEYKIMCSEDENDPSVFSHRVVLLGYRVQKEQWAFREILSWGLYEWPEPR